MNKTIRFRRLTLLGHILRHNSSTLAQNAMENYFNAPYIPTKGRPKTTLASVLKNDLKCMEILLNNREDLEKLKMLAERCGRSRPTIDSDLFFNYILFQNESLIIIKSINKITKSGYSKKMKCTFNFSAKLIDFIFRNKT